MKAARTAVTAAQNGGRMATYKNAEDMGIPLKKMWMATPDSRTRDSHALIDGEIVDTDKKFSNGCRYPGDPQGRPAEVYNCRCTMVADIVGYKYSKTYTAPDGNTAQYRRFKEWQQGKLASGDVILVNYATAVYNTDIGEYFTIGRSLGAKAINYEIEDKTTGIVYHFIEGTRVENIKVFAGYKGIKPLEEDTIEGLMREYPDSSNRWQHAKGIGYIDVYGESVKAEIHWFQEENVGKCKFKVKEWLYDES